MTTDQEQKRRRVFLAIGLGVVILILAGLGIFLYTRRQSKPLLQRSRRQDTTSTHSINDPTRTNVNSSSNTEEDTADGDDVPTFRVQNTNLNALPAELKQNINDFDEWKPFNPNSRDNYRSFVGPSSVDMVTEFRGRMNEFCPTNINQNENCNIRFMTFNANSRPDHERIPGTESKSSIQCLDLMQHFKLFPLVYLYNPTPGRTCLICLFGKLITGITEITDQNKKCVIIVMPCIKVENGLPVFPENPSDEQKPYLRPCRQPNEEEALRQVVSPRISLDREIAQAFGSTPPASFGDDFIIIGVQPVILPEN